jgi:hypothetical protein
MDSIKEDVVTSVGAIGCNWQAKNVGIKGPQPTTSSFNLYKSCNQILKVFNQSFLL